MSSSNCVWFIVIFFISFVKIFVNISVFDFIFSDMCFWFIFITLRFVLISCSWCLIMQSVSVVIVYVVQHTEYLVIGFKLALIPTLLFCFLTMVTVLMVSVFEQWCSLLCLSVNDVVQTHQQTLLFDADQHHQQTNTIGVSKSGFMLGIVGTSICIFYTSVLVFPSALSF